MIRSLRARLFVAILGTVLIAVGASLALGVLLTRSAVQNTISRDVERQDEAFARQMSILPRTNVEALAREGAALTGSEAPHTASGATIPARPAKLTGRSGAAIAPLPLRGAARPGGRRHPQSQIVLSSTQAAKLLPSEGVASLRSTGSASGTAKIDGQEQIYAARRVANVDAVALVVRPDIVSGGDFRRYLVALLIASGAAAVLAAGVAALLARRLTDPLRRLAGAAGELAHGRRPDTVPLGGTVELDELAFSFNEMSEQLALARDAERAVLLSVSHDLRTPLTSIRGYAEGIEDGTVAPREGAAVLAREATRLERLVGDLLALTRLRQGVLEVRREPVDLSAIAREAEVRLRPRASEQDVRIEVTGDHAPALADHDRVLQIVTNLVENAVRMSPAGETVRIDAGPGSLSVRDRGPGIPEAEIPHAFERFHLRSRTGDRSGGAGLGLAIVRELAEAMGGRASVENLPDVGACFTVALPQPQT